ncbi:MAG: hypothetical protein JNM27_03345 [Leptospirales bacterium]|nr:hypothetical protein [Leptospirales bacterium]
MKDFPAFIGFLTAHAVWSVSDGGPLIPFVGIESDGKRDVHRFASEMLEEGVQKAREYFLQQQKRPGLALLAFDGFVTLEAGKIDAVIVEAADSRSPTGSAVFAIPYRPADHAKGFAVHRPKFMELKVTDPDGFTEDFWNGVDSHEQAAKVWNDHLDQSI